MEMGKIYFRHAHSIVNRDIELEIGFCCIYCSNPHFCADEISAIPLLLAM